MGPICFVNLAQGQSKAWNNAMEFRTELEWRLDVVRLELGANPPYDPLDDLDIGEAPRRPLPDAIDFEMILTDSKYRAKTLDPFREAIEKAGTASHNIRLPHPSSEKFEERCLHTVYYGYQDQPKALPVFVIDRNAEGKQSFLYARGDGVFEHRLYTALVLADQPPVS